MSKQLQKYHLSLAGEFFVAAELQRQGLSAAVTYGNAKSADVVAFSTSGEKAIVIEVKVLHNSSGSLGAGFQLHLVNPGFLFTCPVTPLPRQVIPLFFNQSYMKFLHH